jgi:hypothetical protein
LIAVRNTSATDPSICVEMWSELTKMDESICLG